MNFIIPLVIYPFDIMVSIDETDKELASKLIKFGIKKEAFIAMNMSPTAIARCVMFDGNQTVMRFRLIEDKNKFISKIAHETLHAISGIFDVIGIKFTDESEEAYTYLLDYIILQILNRIK
jgi:hypothetical protein